MQLLEPRFVVKPAQESFEFWLNQSFISAPARRRLLTSDRRLDIRRMMDRSSGRVVKTS